MRENVTISYRGARYEIGRGQHFYGIWVAGAPQAQPLEWWPETPAGWTHAWARFAGIEVPGTIVAVSPPAPPPPPPPAPTATPITPATSATPNTAAAPFTPPVSPATEAADAATPPTGTPVQQGQPASGPQAPPASGQQGQSDPGDPAGDPAQPTSPAGESSTSSESGTSGAPGFGTPGSGEPGASSEPGASAEASAPGETAGFTVMTGQPPVPIVPVGHPAALSVQPATLPGPSTSGTGWAGQIKPGGLIAAGLLLAGVICGIAGLFPGYLGGSLAQEPANLVPHVIYFAAWTGAAVLILLGGAQSRLGTLLAAGTSVVTFGLFFADAGTAISEGASVMGAGLVLGLIGWLACALGSGLALRLKPDGQPAPGRPQSFAVRHVLTMVAALGGLGTAIAFAPSWDSYLLRAANGTSLSTTAGNAFSNPGWVITGDVLTMISVVVIVVVAAVWRPVREGAWLLAGAVIPMAAQAISALIGVSEPTSPAQFGIPPANAAQAGITITNGVTPAFWLFGAFVIVLMVTCGWMLLSPRSTSLDTPPQRGGNAMAAGAAYLLPPGSVYAPPPGSAFTPVPGPAGALPGGFEQVVEQQQLGDSQRF